MGNNTYVTSTITDLQVSELDTFESTGNENLNVVRVLFEYLFTTDDSLKEKNKYLLLYLQFYIQQNNYALLNQVFEDDAIRDLHPSLLKSALIMSEHVPEVEESRQVILQIFNKKNQLY